MTSHSVDVCCTVLVLRLWRARYVKSSRHFNENPLLGARPQQAAGGRDSSASNLLTRHYPKRNNPSHSPHHSKHHAGNLRSIRCAPLSTASGLVIFTRLVHSLAHASSYGHTCVKIPGLVRSRKSSTQWRGQYCGGRLHGNTACCSFAPLFVFYSHAVLNQSTLL